MLGGVALAFMLCPDLLSLLLSQVLKNCNRFPPPHLLPLLCPIYALISQNGLKYTIGVTQDTE